MRRNFPVQYRHGNPLARGRGIRGPRVYQGRFRRAIVTVDWERPDRRGILSLRTDRVCFGHWRLGPSNQR